MVTLDLTYSRLKELLGKNVSTKELEEKLFDMGMELEAEGDNLKIDITPDRIDMLSVQGLARSLKAYLGLKKGLPRYEIKKSNLKVLVDPSVAKVRPYTACALIKNLKFNNNTIKEMIWIQEKLHATFGRNRKRAAIGIYPFEKIKGPIRYLAEDPEKISFRPLESNFKMNGYDVLKKYKEYAPLLDYQKKYPIFKDANDEILSMPPIINSHELGRVTQETKDIFIECSGSELKPLKELVNILAAMFADMGGDIYSVEIDYGNEKLVTPDLKPEKRNLKLKDVEKLIGTCPKNCKELLERMMYNVISIDKNKIVLEAPAFRVDLWHDVDVIDDIARAYGFNNLEPRFPLVATVGETEREIDLSNDLRSILIGQGLFEVFTLILSSKEDQFEKMNIKELPHVALKESTEKSINMARVWLTPELLKSLHNNRSRTYPQNIFEINYIIKYDENSEVKSKDALRLAVALCHEKANFTEIKQVLDSLMNALDLSYNIEEVKHDSFISGRVGRVSVKGKEVAYIGEIHPQVLVNFNLSYPVATLELNLTDLLELL